MPETLFVEASVFRRKIIQHVRGLERAAVISYLDGKMPVSMTSGTGSSTNVGQSLVTGQQGEEETTTDITPDEIFRKGEGHSKGRGKTCWHCSSNFQDSKDHPNDRHTDS